MSRLDIAAGGLTYPGAGAALRVHWPRGITDGSDATGVDKFGGQDLNGFSVTAYAGGTEATEVTQGAAAVNFKSTNGPTGYGVNYARTLSWFTERTGPNVADWNCWSWKATVAFSAAAGALAGDCGLQIWCGNHTTVNGDGTDTSAGVKFGPTDTGVIALQARRADAGALTVNTAVAAGLTPTLTNFNTYELQIITGSNSSDPQLIALINSVVVVGPVSWTAAAGLLPPPNAVAGNFGYRVALTNRGAGSVASMWVFSATLTAASNAAALV